MNLELYRSLRAGKPGYVRLSRALWKLTGNDRVRYLNGQVTNDIKKLAAGRSLYAAVPNAKGKFVGDCFISATADALWIDAPLELREALDQRLQKYLIADDAELVDVTDEWTLFHLIGSVEGSTPADVSQNFANARFGLPGHDFWIAGTSEPSFPWLPDDIVESLRLEHGLAKWGVDMTEENLPPEAGLDRYGISYTKGCYLGQETIARIKSIGHVNKSLLLFQSDTPEIPAPGAELRAGDKVVGTLTSSAYSPALEKGIALGYVQRQHARIGERLSVGPNAVTIIEPPLQLASS
ncbi:MAG: hypothetical protein B9S32_06825 [Verrucomicrobia bacterium Tous-C9LFEB]|nr:MAG: hypothetical protein B9S32_06825 [Verrucomicrobia bacterium Tous-C9LFEB]